MHGCIYGFSFHMLFKCWTRLFIFCLFFKDRKDSNLPFDIRGLICYTPYPSPSCNKKWSQQHGFPQTWKKVLNIELTLSTPSGLFHPMYLVDLSHRWGAMVKQLSFHININGIWYPKFDTRSRTPMNIQHIIWRRGTSL